jgi:ActR/RegA family two-component response regulator
MEKIEPLVLLSIRDRVLHDSVSIALRRHELRSLGIVEADVRWNISFADAPIAALIDHPQPHGLVRDLAAFMPALPILVLTGYRSTGRALSLITLGNVRIRQKPLDVEQMLAALGLPLDVGVHACADQQPNAVMRESSRR